MKPSDNALSLVGTALESMQERLRQCEPRQPGSSSLSLVGSTVGLAQEQCGLPEMNSIATVKYPVTTMMVAIMSLVTFLAFLGICFKNYSSCSTTVRKESEEAYQSPSPNVTD